MAGITPEGGTVRHGRLAYRVVVERPLLRLERLGHPDPGQLKHHCFAMLAEAHGRGAHALLIDERYMAGFMPEGLDSLLVYREIVREAQGRGLADRPLRIAVVSPREASADHRYLAHAANGVGFEIAYFDTESDAVAWLTSGR